MPIYGADTLNLPPIEGASSGLIINPFIATVNTMLSQPTTAALGFLAGDLVLLSIIPPAAVMADYQIVLCNTDTSTGSTWSVGDSSIASGAVTGQLSSTSQTSPTSIGTSFTLTASASTASFASSGVLLVGSTLVQYGGISGSTFTTCYAQSPGVVWPAGTPIQQAANYAFYSAAVAVGQSSHPGVFTPNYWVANTSATFYANPGQLPQSYVTPLNTWNAAVGAYPPTYGQVAPIYFLLRCAASATTNPTYTASNQFVGWISYYIRGPWTNNADIG
jgi:hypothetical protein